MSDRRRLAWLVLALCAALPAAAQSGWDALPAEERALLAPWQTRWEALDAAQRERLRRNTRHWLSLDAAQRAQLQARLAAWEAMPPAQRAQIRERAAAWQRLAPSEQAALRASHAQVQAMAPVERAAMRDAFAQVGTSEKRALLVGENEQALAEVAREAFAFVPPDARGATLDMLRSLAPGDRELLATLASRIGPEQRDPLRRELLARPRAQRGAYLRERLDAL